jgi:hypothetical protein
MVHVEVVLIKNYGNAPEPSYELVKCSVIAQSVLSMLSRPVLEPTQRPIRWILGALSLEVKWPGHEAEQSPSTGAEIKNTSIFTFTPPYVFMA